MFFCFCFFNFKIIIWDWKLYYLWKTKHLYQADFSYYRYDIAQYSYLISSKVVRKILQLIFLKGLCHLLPSVRYQTIVNGRTITKLVSNKCWGLFVGSQSYAYVTFIQKNIRYFQMFVFFCTVYAVFGQHDNLAVLDDKTRVQFVSVFSVGSCFIFCICCCCCCY